MTINILLLYFKIFLLLFTKNFKMYRSRTLKYYSILIINFTWVFKT